MYTFFLIQETGFRFMLEKALEGGTQIMKRNL